MGDTDEELLRVNPNRYTLFPLMYPDVFEMYKKAEMANWSANEIDFSSDCTDWNLLSSEERYFLENVLAFFAGSDGIVLENLMVNFSEDVQIPEARAFYAHQAYIETVHQETYAKMIDTLITDSNRKKELFESLTSIPIIKTKGDWAFKWMNRNNSFAKRLFGFIIVEGVFFCSSFCAIFWMKDRNKLRGALAKSNELISRDERLHTRFAILLYSKLKNKCSQITINEIISEAVQIEIEFITKSLPCSLIGMNSTLMIDYVKYVADGILIEMGYTKLYGVKNPFPFMERLDQQGVTNFFEQRVSEYKNASTILIDDKINLTDDF